MIRHTFAKAILACSAAALAACITSCDSTPDISGQWAAAPTQFASSGTPDVSGTLATSQIASRITFNPSEADPRTGTVAIESDIALLDAVPADSLIVNTYEISVSATASVTGTYRFEDDDDDEVLIALDDSSLAVYVDPDAVAYSLNVLDQEQQPELEKMRPALAAKYRDRLMSALPLEYARYQKLNDVKVKNGILSCEINHRDFTFRRVP